MFLCGVWSQQIEARERLVVQAAELRNASPRVNNLNIIPVHVLHVDGIDLQRFNPFFLKVISTHFKFNFSRNRPILMHSPQLDAARIEAESTYSLCFLPASFNKLDVSIS